MSILVSPFSHKGGCNDGKTKITSLKRSKHETIRLINLKSKNNNCLIQCFNTSSKNKGNKIKNDSIRKELGLPLGTKIDIKDVDKIADYFQQSYVLINQSYNIIGQKLINGSEPINLMLINEHYYLIEILNSGKCVKCGDRYVKDLKKHTCNITKVSYYKRKKCHEKNMVMVKNIEENKIDYNDIIYFDLETFQEAERHVPYACGWYNKKYNVSYGQNCINKFIDEIVCLENKTITAYNGSGFDFYFLIDKLTERGVHVGDIILTNGKVMSFKFGEKEKENKCFDLYLFIMSSLDKACKDFKIQNAKSSFDHTKIKNWDDTKNYKSEVLPYLRLDVLGLKELFQVFNDMMYDLKSINITSYVTLSHMSYCIWTSMLKDQIEIPNDMEKYDLIKKATYGGRCYPQQKVYKSKYYDDVVNKKMNYDDLIKTGDFIFNADATSLYPASMKGFELVDVLYPTGLSRWCNIPEVEFKNNRIGFYEIKFTPPKDIRTPILPRKVNLGIRWSLEDGQGVYTSVDIQNAIDAGYQVEFINKCLVWDESSKDVFGKYVSEFYKLKEDAEKKDNKVKRSIAKLMLNALYGKTLQKAIFNQTAIVNNIFEFNKFILDKDNKNFDWVVLNDNKLLVSGEIKDADKYRHVTKPCQLGAFVTAYSRRINVILHEGYGSNPQENDIYLYRYRLHSILWSSDYLN